MTDAKELRAADFLGHIVEAIERIHRYVEDMDEARFMEDEKTQDAVIRNIENLGEAARNIERYHEAFAAAHPEIPWAVIYGMRNRVSHGYFTVDLAIIWRTIQTDLPELHRRIKELASGLN